MDIGTHLATGLVASTFFESPTVKIACIVGSIAPDLVGIPRYIYKFLVKKEWKFWEVIRDEDRGVVFPDWMMRMYYFSHSLLFSGLLVAEGILFDDPLMFAFSIGYLSHVMWDIPTHVGKWANRPFYPFSNCTIEGYQDWWQHKVMRRFAFVMWVGLFSAYFFIT